MATRILYRSGSVGTADTPVGDVVTPPEGIKWTLVEIRPRFSGTGTLKILFDTELYYTIRSTVTPGTYAKPHVVAIDVAKPHRLVLTGAADSGNITIECELVIEESPLTPPG